MNARVFVGVGGVVLLGTAFVVQACGETETTAPSADAGQDVVATDTTVQKDTAPVSDDAATCDLSADFTTRIPDASVADGATTTGLCVQCANSKCPDEVEDCNTNCDCQGLAGKALECFLKNSSNPQLCAADFLGVDTATQQIGFGLIGCINTNCKEACATASFQQPDASADAATEDAGDAGN